MVQQDLELILCQSLTLTWNFKESWSRSSIATEACQRYTARGRITKQDNF